MGISRARLTAIVLATVAVCLTSCSGIREPDVQLTGIDLVGVSAEGLEFKLRTTVENPNDFGADIGRFEYSIYGDGIEIAHGQRDEDAHVAAGATVDISVPFVLEWSGGKTIFERILDGGEHNWKIKGSVDVKKGVVRRTFTFSESGVFNSPDGIQDL
ncbi:LEA type 2 family protein [bacterium]|nr:LEA type 2 family protein [bacterium]